MNKKLLLLFFVIIFMTGCSKNKLSCTSSEVVRDNNYETTVKFDFKKDEIKKFNMIMNVIVGETNMENYSLYLKSFKDTFKEYDNREGLTYKIIENKDGYKLDLTVELKDFKDATTLFNKTIGYDATKKYYENLGYKCK